MSTPRTTCAVTGCTQAPATVPWSAYCSTHASRLQRTGSPLGRALTKREILRHQDRIARAIATHLNSPAVQSALLIAADILAYRPRMDFGYELKIEAQMQRLVAGKVTPRELLMRVCCIWALQAFDSRFNDERELNFALARAVLRLRSAGERFRPAGPLLRYLGKLLQEELGRFAAALCMRVEGDEAVRAKARAAFEHGWSLPGE